MAYSYIIEQLNVLKKQVDQGLHLAREDENHYPCWMIVDILEHMLDEIERTKIVATQLHDSKLLASRPSGFQRSNNDLILAECGPVGCRGEVG